MCALREISAELKYMHYSLLLSLLRIFFIIIGIIDIYYHYLEFYIVPL